MGVSRRPFLFTVLFLFGIVGFLFFSPRKDAILFSLSPQSEVNPEHAVEDFDPGATYGIFNSESVNIPTMLALIEPVEQVLGETAGNKRIEIDLTNQRLYAYEGDRQVYNFLISSGLWGRTPTGTFSVWTKLRATKMEGGSKALRTYYYLPNVPYTMFFSGGSVTKKQGYGIHGTYWHNNFGHPMSHGCINMKTEEASQLFSWAYVGIPVVIYGSAPAS